MSDKHPPKSVKPIIGYSVSIPHTVLHAVLRRHGFLKQGSRIMNLSRFSEEFTESPYIGMPV